MNKSINVMIAAAAGFVAGMLLAPKSGAETREDLKNKAREAKDRLDDKTEEAKKAAREATETLREGATYAEREARGLAESARQSARTIADEAAALGDEAKARTSRVVEGTRQSAAAKRAANETAHLAK